MIDRTADKAEAIRLLRELISYFYKLTDNNIT